MRRLPLNRAIVGSALLLCVFAGCNNREASPDKKPAVKPKPAVNNEPRTALQAKSLDGVLKGRVVFEGEVPPPLPNRGFDVHPDKSICLKGGPNEASRYIWVVDKQNKGLANVVVWLEPPDGKYFLLTEHDKNRQGEVMVIDQPHCAFVPHVTTLFPAYFDGSKQVKTGQKLEIRNSAELQHSIQWQRTYHNENAIHNIPPKGKVEVVLNPENKVLFIGCSHHHWMHGVLWIFDHPYHAVTKEDGTFQINNVPTGVELTFKAWHETRHGPFEEKKVTLQKGENPPIELTARKEENPPIEQKAKK
jgi:hypothetical protein